MVDSPPTTRVLLLGPELSPTRGVTTTVYRDQATSWSILNPWSSSRDSLSVTCGVVTVKLVEELATVTTYSSHVVPFQRTSTKVAPLSRAWRREGAGMKRLKGGQV